MLKFLLHWLLAWMVWRPPKVQAAVFDRQAEQAPGGRTEVNSTAWPRVTGARRARKVATDRESTTIADRHARKACVSLKASGTP